MELKKLKDYLVRRLNLGPSEKIGSLQDTLGSVPIMRECRPLTSDIIISLAKYIDELHKPGPIGYFKHPVFTIAERETQRKMNLGISKAIEYMYANTKAEDEGANKIVWVCEICLKQNNKDLDVLCIDECCNGRLIDKRMIRSNDRNKVCKGVALEKVEEVCGNCHYVVAVFSDKQQSKVYCRRYPPPSRRSYPEVENLMSCGEFKQIS